MSRPEARTAWSALWKRRQSPSSLRIATEVSHPTPKRLCSSPAPRLGLGEADELGAQRLELAVEGVDHEQARLHRLAAGRRHLHLQETPAVLFPEEVKTRDNPLVEHLGLKPLLPLDALVDQSLAQPH